MAFFECIGYLSATILFAKLGLDLASWFKRRYLSKPLDVAKCGGKWALVTGSTDGIGKAYAFALAKKKLNLILVSRSPFKLQNVAADLETKYNGVQSVIVAVDFVKEQPSEYVPKIEEAIKGLDIGVLVNNVGMSYDHPKEYLELDDNLTDQLIDVNIRSLNAMTKLILPQMVERKNGAIINISSLSGTYPNALLSAYSASKAYVDRLSNGLSKEYEKMGVTIQCVLPGYVVSKMSNLKSPTLSAPTPDIFVKSALSRLGIDSRTAGYWFHDIMLAFVEALPSFVVEHVSFKQMKVIKQKALKRKLKQK